MPIYVYKCSACGHTQDVLQKMSDPLLTVCPQCHQETYAKQLTAAGFQLKGSGWYVTDFRDGGSNTGAPAAAASGQADAASGQAGAASDKAGAATPAPAPAASNSGTASTAAPASPASAASGSAGTASS